MKISVLTSWICSEKYVIVDEFVKKLSKYAIGCIHVLLFCEVEVLSFSVIESGYCY